MAVTRRMTKNIPFINSLYIWKKFISVFGFHIFQIIMYNLILESKTIEDFGETLHLDRHDIEHLRSVFLAVENGDLGMLKSLGIKDSEIGDVKFFLEKLVNTGFLD